MATLKKANKEALAPSTSKETVATTATPKKKILKKKKIVAVSKKATDTKNIKDTVTKIVESKREVKYIYPEEIKGDALKMKGWRAKMRDKDKSYLKDIAAAAKKKEDTTKLEKAYMTWRKSVYLVP